MLVLYPVTVKSIIHLTKNQLFHEMAKHKDVRYYFVHDVITDGSITVEKIVITKIRRYDSQTDFSFQVQDCLDLIGIRRA